MRDEAFVVIDELARKDPRIVFIGSDIGRHTLKAFRETYPDRFIMEGISEQHIVSMAAGMAMTGLIPFVCSLSSFISRRSYEQILIDVCLHNLPVRFVCFGGGSVYSTLGPTHMINEDFALYRNMPNMTIIAACDAIEMRNHLNGTAGHLGPIYYRFARGEDEIVSDQRIVKLGEAIPYFQQSKINIFTTGVMLQRALKARALLVLRGINCGLLHFPFVKPLDSTLIQRYAESSELIISVEEHFISGGFGSALLEHFSLNKLDAGKLHLMGIPNEFISLYGVQEDVFEKYGLTEEMIVETVCKYSDNS